MSVVKKTCPVSKKQFEISGRDIAFYQKISPVFAGERWEIPPPTLSPQARLQRRLSWRNERHLYRRCCDSTKLDIISTFPKETAFPVFSQEAWWSDTWDASSFTRSFDFSKTFFEQFSELQSAVPRIALINVGPENSDYINCAGFNKNCYMCSDIGYNEKLIYCKTVYQSNNLLDCAYCVNNCSYLYDCFQCSKLQDSIGCIECSNGAQLLFSFDLQGCNDCAFCCGMRNKRYCIENRQLSREDYLAARSSYLYSLLD